MGLVQTTKNIAQRTDPSKVSRTTRVFHKERARSSSVHGISSSLRLSVLGMCRYVYKWRPTVTRLRLRRCDASIGLQSASVSADGIYVNSVATHTENKLDGSLRSQILQWTRSQLFIVLHVIVTGDCCITNERGLSFPTQSTSTFKAATYCCGVSSAPSALPLLLKRYYKLERLYDG